MLKNKERPSCPKIRNVPPAPPELDSYAYCGHSTIVGNKAHSWQDIKGVLLRFSNRRSVAQQRYRSFVEKGFNQGKRDDLTGGGLIRSAGGWAAVQTMRDHDAVQKSDERIPGDGAFVERVLREAGECVEHRLRQQALGIDFNTVIRCVCEVTGCSEAEMRKPGKDRRRVQARSLLCYWAVDELRMSQAQLGKRLNLSAAGLSLSVRRGEAAAHQLGCKLLDLIAKLKK